MDNKETMEMHGNEAEFDFASALDGYLNTDFGDLEEGTIVKGEIVRVDDDNVLVDVSFKSEGQIPTAEFRAPDGTVSVKVGDKVDVYVARKNEQEGTITLSFEKATAILRSLSNAGEEEPTSLEHSALSASCPCTVSSPKSGERIPVESKNTW